MNEVMTRAEMEERFQGEWLLIDDPEVDEHLAVLRGRVVRQSADRDEVYQTGATLCSKLTASLYVPTTVKRDKSEDEPIIVTHLLLGFPVEEED